MSIGLGIFASVVLILMVYHKGFRKVALWIGGVAVSLALLAAVVYFGYDRYSTWAAKRAEARDNAAKHAGTVQCMTRLGTPWVSGTPQTLPASYFSNLQACTSAPDDYVSPGTTGDVFDQAALQESLPSGYKLDRSNHVVPAVDLSAGLVPKNSTSPSSASDWKDVPPCSDSLPIGFIPDAPCLLSGRPIQGFLRAMCVGTIQANGDCVTNALPGLQSGTYAVQICPYGLPINANHDCPSWKNVDVKKEEEKLAQYRIRAKWAPVGR